MNENLFVALRDAFPADLDAIAIETADGAPLRYSWRDLERATAMLANLLDSLELPAGARVAVQTEKSVEALMLYLAVLRAGYVYLPLNSAYQAAEIEYFIGDAEPSVFVCSPETFARTSKIAFRAGTSHVFTLGTDRSGSLLERAAHHPDRHTPAVRGADELAAILYTSGTTGRSKGAMLSHGNLLSNARTLQRYWGWQPGDVLIHALPIFHVHGLFVASHGALLNGSKMLWFSRFDAARGDRRLPEATVFMGVPTLYVRLLAEPGLTREACARMRLFISGSAPLLLETFEPFRERTGHTILERYGMSETVMLTSNPYAEGDGERRGGTVGFAAAGRRRAHRRLGRQRLPRRRDRRRRGSRAERLRGLLAHAREDARGVHRRRLVQDRRRRPPRCRGAADHRRPQQGSRHQRRLQRLPRGDRGRAQRDSGRGRERRRRRAAPGLRRGRDRRSSCRAPMRRPIPSLSSPR